MTKIEISIPDDLAVQAQESGLLSTSRIESWLREQIRQQRKEDLAAVMERLAAVSEGPAMSPEEVAVEVHSMRAERNLSRS